MKIEVIVRLEGYRDILTCTDPVLCARILAELAAFEAAVSPEKKIADLREELAEKKKDLESKNSDWAKVYSEKEALAKKLKELGHGT